MNDEKTCNAMNVSFFHWLGIQRNRILLWQWAGIQRNRILKEHSLIPFPFEFVVTMSRNWICCDNEHEHVVTMWQWACCDNEHVHVHVVTVTMCDNVHVVTMCDNEQFESRSHWKKRGSGNSSNSLPNESTHPLCWSPLHPCKGRNRELDTNNNRLCARWRRACSNRPRSVLHADSADAEEWDRDAEEWDRDAVDWWFLFSSDSPGISYAISSPGISYAISICSTCPIKTCSAILRDRLSRTWTTRHGSRSAVCENATHNALVDFGSSWSWRAWPNSCDAAQCKWQFPCNASCWGGILCYLPSISCSVSSRRATCSSDCTRACIASFQK